MTSQILYLQVLSRDERVAKLTYSRDVSMCIMVILMNCSRLFHASRKLRGSIGCRRRISGRHRAKTVYSVARWAPWARHGRTSAFDCTYSFNLHIVHFLHQYRFYQIDCEALSWIPSITFSLSLTHLNN